MVRLFVKRKTFTMDDLSSTAIRISKNDTTVNDTTANNKTTDYCQNKPPNASETESEDICLNHKNIRSMKDWPQGERPREKLLLHGAQYLSNAELLAIFLRTGTLGKNVVDMARELLSHYQGLRDILNASQQQLCRHKGLGIAKYVQLQAALELGNRYLQETLQRSDVLTSPELVKQYLKTQLGDQKNEVFACLFLDNQHRVIVFETLFQGTIHQSTVHLRVVVQRCLAHNAAAVIFAHNHPSGFCEPSEADIEVTQSLKQALLMIDVSVLDHIIIGDGQPVSMVERDVF